MRKKLLVLDFDGVIHSYRTPWQGPKVIPDPPTPGFFDWLEAIYYSDLFEVAIFSSRSRTLGGRRAMKRWLRSHLIGYFGITSGKTNDFLGWELYDWIKWPWFKPAAFLTIDDRAITFRGTWATLSPANLMEFQPWTSSSRVSPLSLLSRPPTRKPF